MRILIVSPFFPPQNAAASLRMYSVAWYWAREGEDVTVLTTVKRSDQNGLSLPTQGFRLVEIPQRTPAGLEFLRRREKLCLGEEPEEGAPDGMPPLWLRGLRRLKGRTGIYTGVRMPDLTDFWVSPAAEWALHHGPWDVVVSSAGPYTAHLVAMRVKAAGVAGFWVADYRDLWTMNHAFTGLFPFTVRERWLERQCHRHVDLLTTVSEPLADRLRRASRRPVHVVYNGHDVRLEERVSPAPFFTGGGATRLVYTGALYYPHQDPEPFFRALAEVTRRRDASGERPTSFTAVGSGPEEWIWLARRAGAEHLVDHLGLVSRFEALRLQRDADALVLLDWSGPEQGVMTSKLFEYLYARAPVLVVGGSRDSEAAELLRRTGRGVWLGDTVEAIADGLDRFLRHGAPDLRRDDRAIREFSRENQALRFLERLRAECPARVATPAVPIVSSSVRRGDPDAP